MLFAQDTIITKIQFLASSADARERRGALAFMEITLKLNSKEPLIQGRACLILCIRPMFFLRQAFAGIMTLSCATADSLNSQTQVQEGDGEPSPNR